MSRSRWTSPRRAIVPSSSIAAATCCGWSIRSGRSRCWPSSSGQAFRHACATGHGASAAAGSSRCCLLHSLHDSHVARRPAAGLLRRVRASARLRAVEPDAAEMVDRHADRAGCRVRHRQLVVWVPYLLLRKSPTPLVALHRGRLIPFIVVGNLIAPIWIAPLFNTFEPMQDKALESRILALADRAGIEGSRVFQVKRASIPRRRTPTSPASSTPSASCSGTRSSTA